MTAQGDASSIAALARLVGALEASREGYLTLADVSAAWAGDPDEVQRAVAQDVLLVDYRQQLRADGRIEPVVLCRLNRHHPLGRV